MSHITEITNDQEHDAFIANNTHAVIFFGSYKCHHCQSMTPIYQKLSDKYPQIAFAHVEVTKVHVDNLDGVPVFVGYRDHVPVDTVLGVDERALINMIETELL